ncbi:hypothetical protein [Streptomyces sp. NPDC003247]|uniref:hypothetical protein n=1 Tax=Streptomyces sp. NPDC003247 TaxID=3364677 RepID=UPI00369BE139
MSDDIPGGDVVGVLTEQIETRFGMSVDQLRAAVAAEPTANPMAGGVVKWHGLLLESQAVLDRAEHDLLRVLQSQHPEAAGPSRDLVSRVGAAVTVRDGRATVVRWLLNPNAPGKQDLAAERLARIRGTRRDGPAVPTTAPPRAATASKPGRSAVR